MPKHCLSRRDIIVIAALCLFLRTFSQSVKNQVSMEVANKVVSVSNCSRTAAIPNATVVKTIPMPNIAARLQYPFRIVQAGESRTGSTFQWTLLRKITWMKTPPGESMGMVGRFFAREKLFNKAIAQEKSFVWKIHNFSFVPIAAQHGVTIFTSNKKNSLRIDQKTNHSIYTQWTDNFHVCSLCEIDKYRDFFDLSTEEISQIRDYMKYWEILRKCCSSQSSKYHVAALNGCNMTPYLQVPGYPMCEHYNMTYIEQKFCEFPHSNCNSNARPVFDLPHWQGPGDCARIDKLIAEKSLGFDSRDFQGCDDLQDRLFA